METNGLTKGLTPEMQKYVEQYIRAYLQEGHKQNPIPFLYAGTGATGGGSIPYGKTCLQNELSTTEIGSHGINSKRSIM